MTFLRGVGALESNKVAARSLDVEANNEGSAGFHRALKTLSEPQVHFLRGWEREASHNSTRPSAPAVQNAPAVFRAQDASTSFNVVEDVQVSRGGFASFNVIWVLWPVD
jgi:hypothetical protein